MTDGVPAGFYPDPDDKEIQRYWDGNTWTNVRQRPEPHIADGWYPDAVDKRLERQWDGGLWTNNVRYVRIHDAMVTVRQRGGYEMLRLLATVEGIQWRDEDIRWADITDFSHTIVTSNHFPILYSITLHRGNQKSLLEFAHPARNENSGPNAYQTIMNHLRVTLGSRKLGELLPLVERGEVIRVAGVVLCPQGFGKDGKGDLVSWSEFAGVEVGSYTDIFIQFFQTKGNKKKKAFMVNKVHLLAAWLVPPLADAHVRRYAPHLAAPST